MPIQVPTTFEVLCETLTKGAASIVSYGIDNCGKEVTPSLMHSASKYYEENYFWLKELLAKDRKDDVKEFLMSL